MTRPLGRLPTAAAAVLLAVAAWAAPAREAAAARTTDTPGTTTMAASGSDGSGRAASADRMHDAATLKPARKNGYDLGDAIAESWRIVTSLSETLVKELAQRAAHALD